VYVPNVYDIGLSTTDHERLEGLLPILRREFTALLQANAGDRRWKFPGPLVVRFGERSEVGEGKFEVEASHEAAAQPPEDEPEVERVPDAEQPDADGEGHMAPPRSDDER
jgi:hypothetical protein